METWKIAEIIGKMLEVSALLPDNIKIETAGYKDYLYITVDDKKYKITVQETN